VGRDVFTPADVARYAATRRELRAWGPVVEVSEIGAGNINNVFRVRCERGSFVVKQSMPYVRIDTSWALSAARIHHEAEAYRQWARFAPDAVPALYVHDRERFLVCVEDLADHAVWRGELNAGRAHPEAVGILGRLLARVAFHTGALRLGGHAGAQLRASVPDEDMHALMDNLVFCEPFLEHERNSFPAGAADAVGRLRDDPRVLAAVGRMRRRYVTGGDALIHGDLHTGSVMVADGSAKAIDCEFSAYGPVAWDVGQLAGNLLIALARARVLERDAAALAPMPERLWEQFADELARLWTHRADRGLTRSFLADWLDELSADARSFAACEIVRRVIGIGHVADLEELDAPTRAIAADGLLSAARDVLVGNARAWPAFAQAVIDAVDVARGRRVDAVNSARERRP